MALSNAFATADGIAKSADNFIAVTASGTITNLGFVDGNGAALPVFGGGQPGVLTSVNAVDGGAIRLFADAVMGNRLVLGVDTQGNIVFAVFMDPNAALSQAKVWVVQFEPISNPDAANADDPVNLFDTLGVAASSLLEFNFNALPSGSNLFGLVGTTDSALVVIGKAPVLNADGTYPNTSDVIHTSQGGTPTTIGVNNQMFDPNDGAFFTFVKNPVLASMEIKCFNMANAPQGQSFVTTGLGTGPAAAITAVRVFNAAGQKIEDSALPSTQDPNVTITITNGVATVTGLDSDYRIEWDTGAPHDQILITGVAGKFDIGGFGAIETTAASVDIGDKIRFEDSGPSITATAQGAPTLTVDETVLATNATGAFAAQFTSAFGTDGAGSTGGNSGLVDTASGRSVVLSLVSGQVQGRTAVSNALVFTVSVDGNGNVTLDQIRAVVRPTSDPNESKTLAAANQVVLTATANDGDADQATASLNIGQLLVFLPRHSRQFLPGHCEPKSPHHLLARSMLMNGPDRAV